VKNKNKNITRKGRTQEHRSSSFLLMIKHQGMLLKIVMVLISTAAVATNSRACDRNSTCLIQLVKINSVGINSMVLGVCTGSNISLC